MIASLIEACKLVGVEPQAYLIDVVTHIVESHPQRRLDNLLPPAYPAMPALKAVALKQRLRFGNMYDLLSGFCVRSIS